MRLRVLLLLLFTATTAYGYDCSSNCTEAATHMMRRPCPTGRDPFRMCDRPILNPIEKGLCETQREFSCNLWNSAADYAHDKVKPLLEGTFNHQAWVKADEDDKEKEYDIQCQAAGVAACAALGSQLGGPWGAAVSGSVGLFVSTRICDQSKSW